MNGRPAPLVMNLLSWSRDDGLGRGDELSQEGQVRVHAETIGFAEGQTGSSCAVERKHQKSEVPSEVFSGGCEYVALVHALASPFGVVDFLRRILKKGVIEIEIQQRQGSFDAAFTRVLNVVIGKDVWRV